MGASRLVPGVALLAFLHGCGEAKEELKGDINCDIFIKEFCKRLIDYRAEKAVHEDHTTVAEMCFQKKQPELSVICTHKCPELTDKEHVTCLEECISGVAAGKIPKMTRFANTCHAEDYEEPDKLAAAIEVLVDSSMPLHGETVPGGALASPATPGEAASKGAANDHGSGESPIMAQSAEPASKGQESAELASKGQESAELASKGQESAEPASKVQEAQELASKPQEAQEAATPAAQGSDPKSSSDDKVLGSTPQESAELAKAQESQLASKAPQSSEAKAVHLAAIRPSALGGLAARVDALEAAEAAGLLDDKDEHEAQVARSTVDAEGKVVQA